MKGIFEKVKGFINDESGLTIVEYAVAGGLITVGAIGAFTTVGTQVARIIGAIGEALTGAGTTTG